MSPEGRMPLDDSLKVNRMCRIGKEEGLKICDAYAQVYVEI